MKGSGVFRGVVAALHLMASRLIPRRTKTSHYPDPICVDPYANRAGGGGHPRGRSYQGKPRLGRPPCEPGTITYHDKLVRQYGRRIADHIQFLMRDKNTFSLRGIGRARCGWPTDISALDFISQLNVTRDAPAGEVR